MDERVTNDGRGLDPQHGESLHESSGQIVLGTTSEKNAFYLV